MELVAAETAENGLLKGHASVQRCAYSTSQPGGGVELAPSLPTMQLRLFLPGKQ